MTQLMMTWEIVPTNKTPAARERTRKRISKLIRPSIDERFAAFDAANPHVLVELLRLARYKVTIGLRRISAKLLWEEARVSIRTNRLGEYKLDNSLTASYARKLIELEPSLAGVIELRRRKGT